MIRLSVTLATLAACVAVTAAAQDNAGISLRVLRLGFVFDADGGTLRPIEGVTRSSVLGAPLDLGGKLLAAAVSAKQNHALVVSESDRQVALVRLNQNPPVVERLEGAPPGPDSIFLSPSGEAAALYYRAAGKVDLIANLPDTPSLQWEFDVSGLGLPPAVIAVSDDASRLMFVSDSAGVFEVGPDALSTVALSGTPSVVSFLAHSHDGLLADGAGQLWLVADPARGGGVSPLTGRDDRLAAAFALAPSPDNRRAFLVSSGGHGLAVVDLADNTVRWVACECQPTALHSLDGDSQFQLTELRDRAVWLADAAAAPGGAFPLVTAFDNCPIVARGPAVCSMRLGPGDGSNKITLLTRDFKLVISGTMSSPFLDFPTNQNLTNLALTFSFVGNLNVTPNPPTFSLPITMFNQSLQGTLLTIPFEVTVPISVQGSILDITRTTVQFTSNLGNSAVCAAQIQDLLSPGSINIAKNCQQ